MLVALVAVISLLALFLQPLVAERRAKGIGVLLTAQYQQGQVDSLKQIYNGLSELTYTENSPLGASLDSIQRLFVVGEGVMPYDFWQFEGLETTYIDDNEAHGIVRIQYDEQLVVGDSLHLRGLYKKPALGEKLVLQDPSGIDLDSLAIGVVDDLRFHVVTKPKVAGKFVYRLLVKDSLDTEHSSEPLPVVIREQEQLSILIINTFPTFETKYLKNFLAENGHALLVRSQLTKGKFKFESFNGNRGAIYGFTAQNLQDFDLVITDIGSYRSLSGASQRALKNQVEKEGLGVFIQPEASLIDEGDRFGFRLKRKNNTSLQLKNFPNIKLETYPFAFRAEALLQELITSPQGTIAAYYQQGAGRMGSSILVDTYQLVLDGKEELYQYLWATTLAGIAQKSVLSTTWNIEKRIVQVDEPLAFSLRTNSTRPEVTTAENARIALQQSPHLMDQWSGVVYPVEEGWQQVNLTQDSTARADYYVASPQAWKAVRSFDKRAANRKQFDGRIVKQLDGTALRPINRLWFFLAFAFAMGFLWFEPRFFK